MSNLKKDLEIIEQEYRQKLEAYKSEHSKEQNIKGKKLREIKEKLFELEKKIREEKAHKERYEKREEILPIIAKYQSRINDLKNIRNSVDNAIKKCSNDTLEFLYIKPKEGKEKNKKEKKKQKSCKFQNNLAINKCDIDSCIKSEEYSLDTCRRDYTTLQSRIPLTDEQLEIMEKDLQKMFNEIAEIIPGYDKKTCEVCRDPLEYNKYGQAIDHITDRDHDYYWCSYKVKR
jgi:hypothetical protein